MVLTTQRCCPLGSWPELRSAPLEGAVNKGPLSGGNLLWPRVRLGKSRARRQGIRRTRACEAKKTEEKKEKKTCKKSEAETRPWKSRLRITAAIRTKENPDKIVPRMFCNILIPPRGKLRAVFELLTKLVRDLLSDVRSKLNLCNRLKSGLINGKQTWSNVAPTWPKHVTPCLKAQQGGLSAEVKGHYCFRE